MSATSAPHATTAHSTIYCNPRNYAEQEKYEFCAFAAPDDGTSHALFRDRADSTLLKLEIEMTVGLLGVAGCETAIQP